LIRGDCRSAVNGSAQRTIRGTTAENGKSERARGTLGFRVTETKCCVNIVRNERSVNKKNDGIDETTPEYLSSVEKGIRFPEGSILAVHVAENK